jgi:hypothetical protein
MVINYSFFFRGHRRVAARRVQDRGTVFLLRRLGTAVRDHTDEDTVFLLGRLLLARAALKRCA